MTTFADILDDVYTLTDKPNLVSESKLGVRAATVKLHGLEFWREDRVEEEVAVAVSENQFSLTLATDLSSPCRKINAIKKIDSDVYFEEIDPTQVLDGFGHRRQNTYYRVGNVLNFLTDSGDTSVYVIYYKHPVAVETGYSSWIANSYPILVALEAASFVLSTIGDKEAAQKIDAMKGEHLNVLLINHLDPISSNS
jgi:nitrogen regulatory protein PII-like uncharacterized protein